MQESPLSNGPAKVSAVNGSEHSGTVLVTAFLTGLVGWVGAAFFFSGIVLPGLFTTLAPHEAGTAAAAVFPLYYPFGGVMGVVLLVSTLILGSGANAKKRLWKILGAVVSLMLCAQLYGGLVVYPRIKVLRGHDNAIVEFQRLHKVAVRANAMVLAGGLFVLLAAGRLLVRRD